MLNYYSKSDNNYVLKSDVRENEEVKIKEIIKATEYHQFFSLFDGSIIPNNWLPIIFVIAAGLTGYIYSFGFLNSQNLLHTFGFRTQMFGWHYFHL